MKSRTIYCLAAFTLSVGVDLLFAYVKIKLGWQFHVVFNVAFGGLSYLIIYYAIDLIRRQTDG